MSSKEGNKKVAANRGNIWRENLISGRLDAELHPTRLKLARLKRRMSQGAIASKLGISLATYGAIERSRRMAAKKTVDKISEQLRCPIKQLFRIEHGKFVALR